MRLEWTEYTIDQWGAIHEKYKERLPEKPKTVHVLHLVETGETGCHIPLAAGTGVETKKVRALLAIAPELLNALEHAMSVLEIIDFGEMPNVDYDDVRWEEMEKAIAKARRTNNQPKKEK